MATVPQPYLYPIAAIPGGEFGGDQSNRLFYLISTQLPAATGLVINSDGTNVEVIFDADLEQTDKDTLDALVERCADYFIVSTDGGATDIGNFAVIEKTAGLVSSTAITLSIKAGDGSDVNGFNEAVNLIAPVMNISILEGLFNGLGLFNFTIGAELNRGQVDVEVEVEGLPTRFFSARWV